MQIDPVRLRTLRKERSGSRLQLAKQSGINARTIQRLEKEPQPSRKSTLTSLAKALGVEPGVLTGELPLPEFDKVPASASKQVQISAQITSKARLEYDLIKHLYGVSATELINMAPLFFALLAEGSLAWRRERLKEPKDAIDRLRQASWNVSCISGAYVANGGVAAEENSISKTDLFGEHLLSDIDDKFLLDEYDVIYLSIYNPFASYLWKLEKELAIPGVIDVDSYSINGYPGLEPPLKFPTYNICRDEFDGIANGSNYAKMALKTGHVRISEIPEELMAEDAGEERAKWLEKRMPGVIKDTNEEIEGILREFNVKDDDYALIMREVTQSGSLDELKQLASGLRSIEVSDGLSKERREELAEKLITLGTYREVLVRNGILDPEGDLRKRIEEHDITDEELDRLLADEPEEADSQETNSDIEEGDDDQ